jgi:hypothetical protein
VEIRVKWLRGNDLIGKLAEGKVFAKEGELVERVVAEADGAGFLDGEGGEAAGLGVEGLDGAGGDFHGARGFGEAGEGLDGGEAGGDALVEDGGDGGAEAGGVPIVGGVVADEGVLDGVGGEEAVGQFGDAVLEGAGVLGGEHDGVFGVAAVFEGVHAGAVFALGGFGAAGEAAVAAGLFGAGEVVFGHVDGSLSEAGPADRRRIARIGAARGGFSAICRKWLDLKRRFCGGGGQSLSSPTAPDMLAPRRSWPRCSPRLTGDERRQRFGTQA